MCTRFILSEKIVQHIARICLVGSVVGESIIKETSKV